MPHVDPAARAEYNRTYRARNRAQQRDNRRMADRAKHANQRAEAQGATGVLLTAEVRAVMASRVCAYCGSTDRLGIDHVVPLVRGGLNRPENLVCCCHSCNASKWQVDAPGLWSRKHGACVTCGTTERPHLAGGMCGRCHRADRNRRERGKPRPPLSLEAKARDAARAREYRTRRRAVVAELRGPMGETA